MPALPDRPLQRPPRSTIEPEQAHYQAEAAEEARQDGPRPMPPLTLERRLRAALEVADEQARTHDTIRRLAELRATLVAARDSLTSAIGTCDRRILAKMDGKRVTVEGVGTFERQPGGNRKDWDHRRIAAAAVREWTARNKLADRETGEVVEVLPEVAEHVAVGLVELAGVQYWRTGALRELELDAVEEGWVRVERQPDRLREVG